MQEKLDKQEHDHVTQYHLEADSWNCALATCTKWRLARWSWLLNNILQNKIEDFIWLFRLDYYDQTYQYSNQYVNILLTVLVGLPIVVYVSKHIGYCTSRSSQTVVVLVNILFTTVVSLLRVVQPYLSYFQLTVVVGCSQQSSSSRLFVVVQQQYWYSVDTLLTLWHFFQKITVQNTFNHSTLNHTIVTT